MGSLDLMNEKDVEMEKYQEPLDVYYRLYQEPCKYDKAKLCGYKTTMKAPVPKGESMIDSTDTLDPQNPENPWALIESFKPETKWARRLAFCEVPSKVKYLEKDKENPEKMNEVSG